MDPFFQNEILEVFIYCLALTLAQIKVSFLRGETGSSPRALPNPFTINVLMSFLASATLKIDKSSKRPLACLLLFSVPPIVTSLPNMPKVPVAALSMSISPSI